MRSIWLDRIHMLESAGVAGICYFRAAIVMENEGVDDVWLTLNLQHQKLESKYSGMASC